MWFGSCLLFLTSLIWSLLPGLVNPPSNLQHSPYIMLSLMYSLTKIKTHSFPLVSLINLILMLILIFFFFEILRTGGQNPVKSLHHPNLKKSLNLCSSLVFGVLYSQWELTDCYFFLFCTFLKACSTDSDMKHIQLPAVVFFSSENISQKKSIQFWSF